MMWEVTHTTKGVVTKYLHQQKNLVKQNQTVCLMVDIWLACRMQKKISSYTST